MSNDDEAVKLVARRRDHIATRPEVRNDDVVARLVVRNGDKTWHDGVGFYYWEEDYPEEGSCGAFETREAALDHFREAGVPFVQVPDGRGGHLTIETQTKPPDVFGDPKPGNITFIGGVGWGDAPGGDIIFLLPDRTEAFRLCANGEILELGVVVDHDRAMYEAFKRWLRGAGIQREEDATADAEEKEPQR